MVLECLMVLRHCRLNSDKRTDSEEMSTPVVFAVTITDAGRRLVDYYLTWRGQTVSLLFSFIQLVLIVF